MFFEEDIFPMIWHRKSKIQFPDRLENNAFVLKLSHVLR